MKDVALERDAAKLDDAVRAEGGKAETVGGVSNTDNFALVLRRRRKHRSGFGMQKSGLCSLSYSQRRAIRMEGDATDGFLA